MSLRRNMDFVARAISAEEVQAFRDKVLRLGKSVGQSVYRGDDALETLHVGAFIGDELSSVATICREAMRDRQNTDAWRLRGMATLENLRGSGLGKSLAEDCIAHAVKHGGATVWCKA